MAEDWDLTAVVRGCKSVTNTTSSATIAAAATNYVEEDPFWDWLKNDEVMISDDPLLLDFPNLIEPRANAFEELQQFWPNPTTTTNNPSTNSYGPPVIQNSPTISDFGGSYSGQQQQQYQNYVLPINTTAMRPHFHRGIPPPGFGGFPGQQVMPPQQTLVPRPGYMRPLIPIHPAHPGVALPRLPFPMHFSHHNPRSRRRKSQQKKTVREVTQENLTDLWAWRKYGQKPIKGSPHPRNYYRCSSSKGCAARKQVERSTKDPDIFIVTYSGDHTHPRPTHRNSLAGSTRNKLLASAAPTTQNELVPDVNPISSPKAQLAAEQAAGDEEDMNEDEDEDDVDDFLLLNPYLAEDDVLLEEMKQMGCGTSSSESGGDDFSDKGGSSSGASWAAANCSSAARATVGGGC